MVLFSVKDPTDKSRASIKLTSGAVLSGSRSVPAILTKHGMPTEWPAVQNAQSLMSRQTDVSNLHMSASSSAFPDLQRAPDDVAYTSWYLIPSFSSSLAQAAELMARTKVPGNLQPPCTWADDPLRRHVEGGRGRPGSSPVSVSRRDAQTQRSTTPSASHRTDPRTAVELGKPPSASALKPSSRAEVLVLSKRLDTMLLEAQGDLRREMLAFDRVQSELIRQVHMHCAERGMLLERCRVQHHDWVVRLMLAVQDLKISREKALRAEREDRQIQEARLTEQLNVNRNLKERLSTVTREMEWHHKADMAKSRGEQGKEVERFDGLKAFKSMKNMMAFVKGSYEQDEADRLEAEREAERRVNELYQVLVDELRPDQLNHLVARIMRRLDPDGQLEIVQTVLDALLPEVQVAITADVFASFDQSMMEEMIAEMGEHNEGADAVQLFRQVLHDDGSLNSVEGQKTLAHHFEAASPQARTEYLELLEELLTEKERRTLVEKLGAHIPVAKDAHGDSNDETTGGSSKELMRRQSSKRINLRHAKKVNDSNKLSLSSSQPLAEPSPGTQDANDPFSVPVPEGNADEAPRIGRETPSTLSHLLQKRPPKPPKQMQTGELLRFISAAICHRYKEEGAPGSMTSAEFSAQRRKAGGKAPLFGDTLWEYICVAEDARAAALQQLANVNLTLSLEAAACEQNPAVSKFRIKAFRALCGLHPPPGGQWAAVQADFYLFATHELLTVTTHGQTLGHLQRTLSQELMYIELPKAIAALRNLVSDSKLLTDLTTQVMEMAAEEVEAGRHSSPAVSLDWILDHLMMAWSDTNKKSEDQLQALFEKADDNGDGVLSLSEFQGMLRMIADTAGGPQTTTQQDFAIYNECIAASEAALGRYTDSILPEVFVRVGMANQLLPGAVAMFHLSKQVAEEEPQPVEASRRRSSTRNSRKGSALGV